MQQPSVAIVTTVRDPGPSFLTWIAYHRQVADRLYIFLDDPCNGDAELIPALPGVHALTGEQSSKMSGCNGVMQRQVANVRRAAAQCAKEGIDWLLHIDGDELIWSPAMNLKDYLGRLDPEVSTVSFTNHEVVHADQVGDCFRELHLFKRNGYDARHLEFFQSRKYAFFQFYGNGKSAVRVNRFERPNGVHFFHVTEGTLHSEREVCILHYACPGYEAWLKKYAQLGDFLPYWWDDPRYPITFRFHLESRDAYLASLKTGNWDIARDFYRRSLFAEEDIRQMLNAGALLLADPLAGVGLAQAVGQGPNPAGNQAGSSGDSPAFFRACTSNRLSM